MIMSRVELLLSLGAIFFNTLYVANQCKRVRAKLSLGLEGPHTPNQRWSQNNNNNKYL
jgi:hypothetical protein